MKLTKELAEKYAKYRNRYLYGSQGICLKYPTSPDPCSDNSGRQYIENSYAPFMITSGNPDKDLGTFLNVDRLEVANNDSEIDSLNNSNIKNVHFGDNLVYSSIAFISFISEFAIIQQSEALNIALGIAKSWVRLGTYVQGFHETNPGPYGFLLRHDSKDESDTDENICTLHDSVSPADKNLAPSVDQYSALFSNICLARRILASVTVDPIHQATVNSLCTITNDLILRISKYISDHTTYCIRYYDKDGRVVMPETDRGPYCHAAAYPLAVISSTIIDGKPDNYLRYLGPLTISLIRDITVVFIDNLQNALRNAIPNWFQQKFEEYCNSDEVIPNAELKLIKELCNFTGVIVKAFKEKILAVILDKIVEPILDKVANWNLNPGSIAMNDFLAQFIFDAFVTGSLLDTSNTDIFENFTANISIKRIFELISGVDLPNEIPVNVSLDFEASEPGWWDSRYMGKWPNPGPWHYPIAKFKIPIGDLLNFSIPIPLTDLLRKLTSLATAKEYLQFLVYNLLTAGDLFNGGFQGGVSNSSVQHRRIAVQYNNTWYLSLSHRFYNTPLDTDDAKAVIRLLETAPDNFPNARQSLGWNKDFRWIRDSKDNSGEKIYSGLDFMAPLMISCSRVEDIAYNREILLEALSPKTNEASDMGMFRLPFQGSIQNQKIFLDQTNHTSAQTCMYISVTFDRPIGIAGKVVLQYTDFSGQLATTTFEQKDGFSKIVSVPLKNDILIVEAKSASVSYICFLFQ